MMDLSWPPGGSKWPQMALIIFACGLHLCNKELEGLEMVPSWPKLALSWFRDGCIGLFFPLMDRIFAPSRLKVSPRWVYDGCKVAYGVRKWLKLGRRRTHDDEESHRKIGRTWIYPGSYSLHSLMLSSSVAMFTSTQQHTTHLFLLICTGRSNGVGKSQEVKHRQ